MSWGRTEVLDVTMSRGGVELLFRVFADRYERASILMTSDLPFSEWGRASVPPVERAPR